MSVIMKLLQTVLSYFLSLYFNRKSRIKCHTIVLGGMTKNVYHSIFQNKSGFTVYDGIFFFFMHNQLFTTSSTS